MAPRLSLKGKSTDEIAELFDGQNEDAKDYAYGLAEEIKKELDADNPDSTSNAGDDDERQASFAYETEEPEQPT